MNYTIKNKTYLYNGFPMTDSQVLERLNSLPVQSHKTKINKSTGFEVFWKLYPKKVDKVNALKKWVSLKLYNHESMQECINGLKAQIQAQDERFKREKQFIKSPTVYLNGQCWDDEIIQKKEHKKEWLTDAQVDSMARSGESYVDLFARLSAQGYNFNKNRS